MIKRLISIVMGAFAGAVMLSMWLWLVSGWDAAPNPGFQLMIAVSVCVVGLFVADKVKPFHY